MTIDEKIDINVECCKLYGMTPDYFNEIHGSRINGGISFYWKKNREKVLSGDFKTYSEKYRANPEIISATNPELLVKIDEIGIKYKEAVQNNDLALAQELVTILVTLYEAREIIANIELSRVRI